MPTVTCYLLHFSEPIGDTNNPHGYAQHYIGSTVRDVQERLKEHNRGDRDFCKITAAAIESGHDIWLVRTWDDVPDTYERRLKRYKKARKLCPICAGHAALRRMIYGKGS